MFSQVASSDLWLPSITGPLAKSSCLLFIIYFLGFFIASYDALCLYIITCLATPSASESTSSEEPQPSKDNSEPTKPTTTTPDTGRWRLVLGLFIFSGLISLQDINFRKDDTQSIDEIILNHMGTLFYISLVYVVGKVAISLNTIFVTRGNIVSSSFLIISLTGIIGYFALVMPLGLYGSSNGLSVCVVTLSLVYLTSGWPSGKSPRWKQVCRYWVLHMLIISAPWYAVIQLISMTTKSQDGEDIWPKLAFQGIYIAFVPAALTSFGPGSLIARMLRFDFKTHLDRGGIALRQRTPEQSLNEPQSRWVIIKVATDIFALQFPKPYFTISIITWSFIRIVTIGLCLSTGFPAKSPFDACFYAVLVESPIMMAVIFLWGVVRGETKLLSNYEENWTPKSSKGTQADVTTTQNDEKLQQIV